MINFDFNFVDTKDIKTPILSNTFAKLAITINEKRITEHVGPEHNIEQEIFVSLYPLVQWLVSNWWCINYEVENFERKLDSPYEERHCIKFWNDGFSFPDIKFFCSGENIIIQSKPLNDKYSGNYFINHAESTISRDDFGKVLTVVINRVIERLRETACPDNDLIEAWNSINSVTEDERRYCSICGLLGSEPYELTNEDESLIISTSELVPSEIWDDFFSSSTIKSLTKDAKSYVSSLKWIRSNATNLPKLKEMKTSISPSFVGTPWEKGYQAAKYVRHLISYDGIPIDFNTLVSLFGIGRRQYSAIKFDTDKFFYGLTATNKKSSPAFVINSTRPDQQKFIFSRLIHDYLFQPSRRIHLALSSYFDQQKTNRAFSAEFIAPANEIKKFLPTTSISSELIDSIAKNLNAPYFVIRHQIENHRLGIIAS